jgi:hypothetical protein
MISLECSAEPAVGGERFGVGLAAAEVLSSVSVIGFQVSANSTFGNHAVALARQHSDAIQHLTASVHGLSYHLDPVHAFLSPVAGIIAVWRKAHGPLSRVIIAERSEKCCEQLKGILREQRHEFGLSGRGRGYDTDKVKGVEADTVTPRWRKYYSIWRSR